MGSGRLMFITTLLVGLVACSSEGPETGTLRVTVYGEEFIEQGIPAGMFVDGWAVTFDTFLIAVEGITVARDGTTAPILEIAGQTVFDLTRASDGQGHLVCELPGVDAGAYGYVDYQVAPAGADAMAGNVSSDQVDVMIQSGWSIYVEGTATKGGDVMVFQWGFATTTSYEGCESVAVVEPNTTGVVELTIHADHLFYDSLVLPDPAVAFDLIASADDGDGNVTAEELAALDISTRADYQVGSADINFLWDFVAAQTHTLGHIDGEGHCGTTAHAHGT